MKVLRKRDLPEQIKGEFMLCQKCGGEYSADARDYWHLAPDTPMRCCGVSMRLVKRETRYLVVA